MLRATSPGLTPEMERCAVDCLNSHSVCLRTVSHCLEKGGKKVNSDSIRLLLNCAEICQTTENFILNGQPEFTERVCQICADVCRRCAENCDSVDDDPQMTACAELCRRCAESCDFISGAGDLLAA